MRTSTLGFVILSFFTACQQAPLADPLTEAARQGLAEAAAFLETPEGLSTYALGLGGTSTNADSSIHRYAAAEEYRLDASLTKAQWLGSLAYDGISINKGGEAVVFTNEAVNKIAVSYTVTPVPQKAYDPKKITFLDAETNGTPLSAEYLDGFQLAVFEAVSSSFWTSQKLGGQGEWIEGQNKTETNYLRLDGEKIHIIRAAIDPKDKAVVLDSSPEVPSRTNSYLKK